MNKLTGTLVYCIIDRGVDCYEKNKGQEWKCGVVVDEDTADAFAKLYPKQAATKVKSVDFKEKYKCELPDWAQKNVYVIQLKKNVKLANGEPVPDKYRPRCFEQQGNSRVDITLTKLVANGSVGTLSIDHFDSAHGPIARLKNILVTDLIEYERTENNYESGSEFDDEKAPEPPESLNKTKEGKTPKASKAEKAKSKDEFEDESPF